MAPAVTLDMSSDFDAPTFEKPSASSSNGRTLLLAPPSIAAHQEKLSEVFSPHDRSVTDLQMLDRLSAGLVTLPATTYDRILILTDADGTRTESTQLLGRDVFSKIAQALKAGGKLQSQDGTFGQASNTAEQTEGILAGLVAQEGEGMVKPDYSATQAVPLRFGRKKAQTEPASDAGPPVASAVVPLNNTNGKPAGVGFVDFSDDFGEPIITGEDDDDDLIDEDTLLTEEDLKRPVTIREILTVFWFLLRIWF